MRARVWPFLCRRLGIERASVPGEWEDYATLLDVFTRPLPPESRPLPPDDGGWLAPADGRIVAAEPLSGEGSWVVKGTPYGAHELLPGADLSKMDGWQAIQIYLAPHDYHRFHAPCELKVLEAVTAPGGLQTVDPLLVHRSWRVLARNRRILLHCAGPGGERFALLFVGALNVGGMRFTFDPTLGDGPWVASARRYDPPAAVGRGEELGRFELGSTVVVFADASRVLLQPTNTNCRARSPLLGPRSTFLSDSPPPSA
jgi:phosphatidylserine decarboxylase